VARLLLLAPIVLAVGTMSWSQTSLESVPPHGPVAASSAQDSAAADTPVQGTLLTVELLTRLDAKKCKVNDRVDTRTVKALLVHGQIVVPRDTKIIGHVTEAKADGKGSPGSRVAIAFDRMLLKNGHDVPLVMTIRAIAPPLHTPPAYGGGPDNLADKSTTPYQFPRVGAQAPPTGSSTLTSNYPDNIPAPPSINTGGPTTSAAQLASARSAVAGMKGLSLDASNSASVLSSSTGNLHLDSGTLLTVLVQ
jgi:hypothetical protein